jgi:serine/threonine-protein kinase RsbW
MSDERPGCEFDPGALQVSVRRRVPGRIEALSPAIDELMDVVGRMECARGKEFEIETALREALANAIRHGCRSDPGKSVEVCAACDPQRGMLIVVRDPGPGFDPAEIPSPVLGHNVFRHHGRGIYLINQLMDEVSFERSGNGTEIRMLKR